MSRGPNPFEQPVQIDPNQNVDFDYPAEAWDAVRGDIPQPRERVGGAQTWNTGAPKQDVQDQWDETGPDDIGYEREGIFEPQQQMQRQPMQNPGIQQKPVEVVHYAEPVAPRNALRQVMPSGMKSWNSRALGDLPALPSTAVAVPIALVGAGVLGGGIYYGGWGAVAGIGAGIAASNAYRLRESAAPEVDAQRKFFALAGVVLGGYGAWKVYSNRKGGKKKGEDK